MLNDAKKQWLIHNKINVDDVESVDERECLVTFKDGVTRRITECYTRVMGYIRPTTEFNKGKFSEFKERKYFKAE